MLMTKRSVVLTSGFAMVALGVAACDGGNGSGLPNAAPPGSIDPTFSAIQANLLEPNCAVTGCHFGAGAPQGLRLDAANSYGSLVGVSSSEVPSLLRVAAGDPDNSYLIQKLEGSASVGGQMPLNAPPLLQADINVIRQWISDGASDDRAQSADPIRVTSLSPLPDVVLAEAPQDVVAMFDRDLDVSTVNSLTFLLEASGGDATFSDGNETQIFAAAIDVPVANQRSARFDLSGAALANDTYQVRLLGTGPSIVMDIDANALDGEFDGTFPSGDGVAGGDFVATFSLDVPASGATLDEIQASVFSVSCAFSGCHSGPAGNSLPSGMNLSDADASFASLVGQPSLQTPGVLRVAAGDPDNSYLIEKLEGTAANGARMPLGGIPLDQAVIDDIRLWIQNGANR